MRVTITEIKEMKQKQEKIAMLTAYDYVTAKMVDEAGVPLILVGDSLGMVMLGYESTIPVTMEDMIHHTKAVVRGSNNALIIGDMPFMTYHIDMSDALRNAARFIQEAGAQAVKLEGGEIVADTVSRLVGCGIPVMGHIGLTPQSIHQLGGYKVRGKGLEEARKLLNDARILEEVISDLLGLYTQFVPKHAKQYAKLAGEIRTAVSSYIAEVKSCSFPTEEQSYAMDESLIKQLEAEN
jgi:3-methyl-2-oxobutanoate hydroxymethyltransferase